MIIPAQMFRLIKVVVSETVFSFSGCDVIQKQKRWQLFVRAVSDYAAAASQ